MTLERLTDATSRTIVPGTTLPGYDRAQLTPGIVHLGVGAFHRAHQAVIIDDCLSRGEDGWGIVAASLRSPDTRDALAPQDCLYTLALRDGDDETLRVIGSITDILVAPENPQALLARMCDPAIRIVTLTITEKGYTANLSRREVLRTHPDVIHDIANPSVPKSALGFLVEAVRIRQERRLRPFTVLCCDNLPANGKTLKALLVEFAGLRDQELARFIQADVSCPCSMVDRIVPATTDHDRKSISQKLGMVDQWPVVSEPFWQWVIEDDFPSGRPRFEFGGVELVQDVEPFENMKLRLLNGAHSTIAAIGRVAGMKTVYDVFTDKRARRLIELYWRQAATTLAPGIDTDAYTARLSARFANSALHHRTEQIATDASQKIPQRILAPLRELVVAGRNCDAMTFALAAWICSCMTHDERGETIVLDDPLSVTLSASARAPSLSAMVRRFLEIGEVFDPFWREDPAIAAAILGHLEKIAAGGILATASAVAARYGS